MSPIVRRSIAFAAMLTAVACSEDAATAARKSVTGSYTLETVNGQQLPFTESSSATETVKLTSSQLDARSDGTFQQTFTRTSTTASGTATLSEIRNGSYSVSNTIVAFSYTGASGIIGSLLAGGGLSLQENGVTYQYRK